jgi:Peptidase family M28
MKNFFIAITILFFNNHCSAQNIDAILNAAEAGRMVATLSADDMQGRKTFSKGIDKAAEFIASEFTKSKLQFFNGSKTYFQEFSMIKTMPTSIIGNLDTEVLNNTNIVANTTMSEVKLTSLNDYTIVSVKKDADFSATIFPLLENEKNYIFLIDPFHKKRFAGLQRFTNQAKFSASTNQLFILTNNFNPTTINLNISNKLTEQKLKNVVGVLPGKSKKDEFVIFSGHYDHLGIGKSTKELDSIYNGANDDAAGTTAVMMLSKYFSNLKEKNERTIIFVAFTAEEIGGFGSSYFSKQLNPEKVMAMFNIEMIGTESKWGTNSAYITGYDKSNMGTILQKNLVNSKFKFEPDPYPSQNLFYRSDNATLAALGVPAHTISTSKMDSEKYYHTQDDEIETLDMKNMAEIIKAIALSSTSIINGKETPSRVAKEQ